MKNRLLNIHVNRIIYSNALILFDENSKPVKVDYERHTCSRLNETPGNGKNEKIFNSVIAAIYLWNSWEIHIKNSTYPFEWYGCVQVEDEWLQSGRGTPPYVVFNSKEPNKIKNFYAFKLIEPKYLPLDIKAISILKEYSFKVKKAFFRDDNTIVWRICGV